MSLQHQWSMATCARHAWFVAAAAAGALLTPAAAPSWRPPPEDVRGYSPAEEAALGREAAAVIGRHLARVSVPGINDFVDDLGQRLLTAVPSELVHRGFDFTVAVLNDEDLTSIALPGGPVFISRGMIEIAPTEAALAGLVAHELSHLVLRHATAQAAAGERYQLGPISGRLIGETFSEHAAGVLDRGMQFPAATYFLAYHPEFERQASRLAAHIMARSGYDPLMPAVMVQRITFEAGRGGVRWARRHPGSEDVQALAGEFAPGDTSPAATESPAFAALQEKLRASPSGRHIGQAPHVRPTPLDEIGHSVPVPSGESRGAAAGDRLRLTVPVNWRRLPAGNTVVFAPEGAYLSSPDQPLAATHGLQIGVARSLTGTLTGDVQSLLSAFGRGNAYFTWTPAFQHVRLGGRDGLTTTASNASPVTGEFERVSVWAAHLADGGFLYVVGVAPQYEAGVYTNAFARVLGSMRIAD